MKHIKSAELTLFACSATEKYAAEIFAAEIELRTGCRPAFSTIQESCIVFSECPEIQNRDFFEITEEGTALTFSAHGIRGLIYAVGLFLRKTEYKDGEIIFTSDITGTYTPAKQIRGHQLGYRPTPNTYDKWHPEDYERYYLDLMYFGANTVEQMAYEKGVSNRNCLMDYDEEELLKIIADSADRLDLDISLWSPNCEDTTEEAVKNRERVFSLCSRFDALFPPGGDPGELSPKELFARCREFSKVLKKYHPEAGIWPSAQAPHGYENWGEEFLEELNGADGFVAGVIHGPNHAFGFDEFRRRVPARFPIRHYPDITHNVRCEFPVHFNRDDWNYALCTVSGRESPNPRPVEYSLIHRLTQRYTVGSVSYSEGVNDDLNKAVYSALDFTPDTEIRTVIEDYVRLFFYGCDTDALTDAIFGLEKNWEGSPEENPQIDYTLQLLQSEAEKYPFLNDNYRFNLCLIRAECDKIVRLKTVYENRAIAAAEKLILKHRISEAEEILKNCDIPGLSILEKDIYRLAKVLFDQIGIQLDVENYHADGWERGAILEIFRLPVTDRQWYLNRFKNAKSMSSAEADAYMLRTVNRNKVENDEYYFSLAKHGLDSLNIQQSPGFYMDFQGDRPDKNNGSLPTCMFKLFDHYEFRARLSGFTPGIDYVLMVTYKDSPDGNAEHHKITADGKTVYEGIQFGGEINADFEKEMLPEGYTARMYSLPSDMFTNGCVELNISEPLSGCEICEFRITKKPFSLT